MNSEPDERKITQTADDERGAGDSLRSVVATLLYAAGLFCLGMSIPAIVVGAWIDPPPGGVPAEVIRLVLGFLGAGILWLTAAFTWTRRPWYVGTLLTLAGWAMIAICAGDR